MQAYPQASQACKQGHPEGAARSMQLQLQPPSQTEWAAALRSERARMHASSGPAGHAKRTATPLLWSRQLAPWIESAGRMDGCACSTASAVHVDVHDQ